MPQKNAAAISDQLFSALSRLNWTRLDHQSFLALLLSQENPHDCWLQRIQHCAKQEADLLTEPGRSLVADLVHRGVQLWDHLLLRNKASSQQWLGIRLFLGEASTFSAAENCSLNAIVSSQLGRDKLKVPHWPMLLDWAMRKTRLDNAGVLVVAGTTLFDSTIQFARAAEVPITQLLLPRESSSKGATSLSNWLAESLSSNLDSLKPEKRSEIRQVWLSPELVFELDSSVDSEFSQLPLQDRAAIAIADRVLAVSLDAGGKIATLLERRLDCSDFSEASVFVVIPQYTSMRVQDFSAISTWLDRGAVGYVVIVDDRQPLSGYSRCRLRPTPATLQICCSMREWLEQDLQRWHYLAHCTRGNGGPVPQESTPGYYRRIWNEGRILPTDPYLALLQILTDGRIRGSTWLTRGHQPSVSLSQVVLAELLSRRRFRGHLGRWDWEPYGLLFDQRKLSQARPVIYGNQADYVALSIEEQIFFQPTEKTIDWTIEQEWRVAGDIDLRVMPTESVTVFTRLRTEALQLAAHSAFPVVWVTD